MWMTNPAAMCRQHLLGEHVELHMFLGSILKGVSMAGYLRDNLMEPASMKCRHNMLVEEMTYRGYKHKSPFTDRDQSTVWLSMTEADYRTKINKDDARAELVRRCPECRDMHDKLLATRTVA